MVHGRGRARQRQESRCPLPRLGLGPEDRACAPQRTSSDLGSAQAAPRARRRPGPSKIAKAREAFAANDFNQADTQAAAAVLAVKDFALATTVIQRATAKGAAFHEGWLESVGLYFADPSADLASAKAAFAAGDY